MRNSGYLNDQEDRSDKKGIRSVVKEKGLQRDRSLERDWWDIFYYLESW